jgi:hypothetical protein
MWIFYEGLSVEGRFVIFSRVQVKTNNRRMRQRPAKIFTNVNFLDGKLV